MASTIADDPLVDTALADRLDRIAERIGLMATLVANLREENQRLQGALDRSALENHQLRDRVDATRERVERLIERLPAG